MIRSPEACACPIREVGPYMASGCSSQFFLFMSILESFIHGRCDLADPCNRVQDRDILDPFYDFAVIGGGTAGAVVAARLSENPQWKVLLLEAGGDEPISSSVPAWVSSYWNRNDTDWLYTTEVQENACLSDGGICHWPRGKMLGGTSVVNGMMYMRGNPGDYDGWAVNGAAGWSWFEVLPYFLKSEDNKEIGNGVSGHYHNVGGAVPVQKFRYAPRFAHDVVSAAIELGYPPTSDLNGETSTGFTIAQAYNDKGSRYSSARAYLRPASKRENLHVVLNALGSRVIIHPGTKKVTGVEYIKNGEKHTVRIKREVVLSGGTMNSPQILLLSGIGPKETLDKFNIPVIKDLPGVGQNLHNHIGVNLEFTLNKEPNIPELSWESAMEYMLNRGGPLSGTGMSQLTGKINSRLAAAGGRNPDIQFFFGGYYASCSDCAVANPDSIGLDAPRRSITISVIALQPKSRGYLTLQSIDPEQPPLMQPNYYTNEHELNVIADGARIAYRLINTTILREKYGMKPAEGFGTECPGGGTNPKDEYFKCLAKFYTSPENHQVGTCKMGAKDDPMAVVDPQLKVYGVEGLRVVDCSIIPTVPSGNTAGPAVMIGERGAEFIITTHQMKENRFGIPEENVSSESDASNKDEHNVGSPWRPWDKWNHSHWIHKPRSQAYQNFDWYTKNQNSNNNPYSR